MSIGVLPDGRLLVRDDGNSRMHVFSQDGELLDDWSWDSYFMTSAKMVITPDGTAYSYHPVREAGDAPGGAYGWVPFQPDGTAGDAVFMPELAFEPLSLARVTTAGTGGVRSTVTFRVPFGPSTAETLSPFGATVTGVSDRYRFEVRSFGGAVLIVERHVEPVEVHPEEAAWHRRYTTARVRELEPQWTWNGPEIPSHKPFFTRYVHVDRGGRLWVRRPGPGRRVDDCDEHPVPGELTDIVRCWEDTHITDVFGSDGRFLGEVEFPPEAPLSIGLGRTYIDDDMVLLRLEDEAGTIMVKRYRLVVPRTR
jgi:hypothetical protein